MRRTPAAEPYPSRGPACPAARRGRPGTVRGGRAKWRSCGKIPRIRPGRRPDSRAGLRRCLIFDRLFKHPSVRYAAGKAMRENCPRNAHAAWKALGGRPDPVQLGLQAEKGRRRTCRPYATGAWRVPRSRSTAGRRSATSGGSGAQSNPMRKVPGATLAACMPMELVCVLSLGMGSGQTLDRIVASPIPAPRRQAEYNRTMIAQTYRRAFVRCMSGGCIAAMAARSLFPALMRWRFRVAGHTAGSCPPALAGFA